MSLGSPCANSSRRVFPQPARCPVIRGHSAVIPHHGSGEANQDFCKQGRFAILWKNAHTCVQWEFGSMPIANSDRQGPVLAKQLAAMSGSDPAFRRADSKPQISVGCQTRRCQNASPFPRFIECLSRSQALFRLTFDLHHRRSLDDIPQYRARM